MAAAEDADEAEVLQRDAAGELRLAARLVGAVAVVERTAARTPHREHLHVKRKEKY